MSRKKSLTHPKKVIPFPCADFWTFWDFALPGSDISPVEKWRRSLGEEAEKSFSSLLKLNRTSPTSLQWVGRGKHFFLEGKSKEARIWELCFRDADNVQYRILGIFWPKHKEKQATLLIGCTHKDKIYDPPNCLQTAIDRKKLLVNGLAIIHERKIRTDF